MKAASYTITGAATALAGIERVEVSTDDGITWNFATGKEVWTYEWTIPGDGTYTIKSRVIASDDTIETPGAGHTVTIDSSLPTTSGALTSDETWTGEVAITGDIIVPEGVTLTLGPGAVIRFPALADDTGGGNDTSRSELIVNGILIAEGTEASRIVFTSNATAPARNDWGGIRASSNESLTLRHCTVEYAGLGVEYHATGLNASAVIENSIVRETNGDGIAIYAEAGAVRTVSVINNEVHSNDGIGIRIQATGQNTVLTNTVTGNTVHDNGSYGIYFDTQSYAKSTSTVSGNDIYNNVTYGLYSYGFYYQTEVSAQITGNTIHDSGMGMYIYNNYTTTPSLKIADNTIYNSTTGIYFQGAGYKPSPFRRKCL